MSSAPGVEAPVSEGIASYCGLQSFMLMPHLILGSCSNDHTGAGHQGTSKSLFAKLVLPRPASEKTAIHVWPREGMLIHF